MKRVGTVLLLSIAVVFLIWVTWTYDTFLQDVYPEECEGVTSVYESGYFSLPACISIPVEIPWIMRLGPPAALWLLVLAGFLIGVFARKSWRYLGPLMAVVIMVLAVALLFRVRSDRMPISENLSVETSAMA